MWSRGVDTQRFHPRHRDLQMRTRLSSGQPEKNLLLYAGRLAPEKQVETLLPVLQSRPHLRLALVGDGPARGKLESLFADTGPCSLATCAARTFRKRMPRPIALFFPLP